MPGCFRRAALAGETGNNEDILFIEHGYYEKLSRITGTQGTGRRKKRTNKQRVPENLGIGESKVPENTRNKCANKMSG